MQLMQAQPSVFEVLFHEKGGKVIARCGWVKHTIKLKFSLHEVMML